MTKEKMIATGYTAPHHDRYLCYFFDEEITLGEFDVTAIIASARSNDATYKDGQPIYMAGKELIKYRK